MLFWNCGIHRPFEAISDTSTMDAGYSYLQLKEGDLIREGKLDRGHSYPLGGLHYRTAVT
jgi:hypothetical protein